MNVLYINMLGNACVKQNQCAVPNVGHKVGIFAIRETVKEVVWFPEKSLTDSLGLSLVINVIVTCN